MLEETTQEQRGLFLLNFTRQLIKNSRFIEIDILEQILKEKFPEKNISKERPLTKEEIIEKIRERNKEEKSLKKENLKENLKEIEKLPKDYSNAEKHFQKSKKVLRIPEPRLPKNLSYLKPVATQEPINLPKIDILINDPNVDSIECEGPNMNILVNGNMGRKKTPIKLSQENMEEILNEFSRKSNIPIEQGISKMAVSNLVLTSIKSPQNVQFIIRKIYPKKEDFENIPNPSYNQ